MKSSLDISNFLEEISSLSHSIVLLYFFSLITEEGFLISPCYSLELCLQMDISFLFSLTFHFSSFHSYLLRPTQTTSLPFCISFSWVWSWSLPPVQCHKPPSWTVACTKLFCPWDFLEWVAISFYRESSRPRDWTQVSCIVDRHFTVWAMREVLCKELVFTKILQKDWGHEKPEWVKRF